MHIAAIAAAADVRRGRGAKRQSSCQQKRVQLHVDPCLNPSLAKGSSSGCRFFLHNNSVSCTSEDNVIAMGSI